MTLLSGWLHPSRHGAVAGVNNWVSPRSTSAICWKTDSGLAAAVMADEDVYLKVENEPFTPLNVECHGE
ncbi:MAG: hypothetical protein IGR92_11245 [Leptolyngbyaceae cyanobacterium T60_A2020_046]|nr:hypothetical protein [Leptolyngbyaceae cyanobacterium T60_A2020_046]